MANLPVRRDSPAPMAAEPGPISSDPFQLMRDLFRWEPFAEVARGWPSERGSQFVPQFDVKETAEAFVFRADVPGVSEKDLEVAVANNRLVISGKREGDHEEKNDSYFRRERSWGSFTRSFTLPNNVDPARSNAELRNGVLTLTLPKVEASQPKKITIKASSEKSNDKQSEKQHQPNQS